MTIRTRFVEVVTDPALVPFRFRERQLNNRPQRRGDIDGAQFIAEGDLVVLRALETGFTPNTILCDPNQVHRLEPFLHLLGDTEVLVAEESVRREATGLALALSMVGLFVKPPASDVATLLSKHSRIVMLSQIDNPTNVGAIMRSAQAFGFHGVVLDSETSDPFTRRALRVSMGTSFDASICRVAQLAPVLEEFHANGFTSCALTPARDAFNMADIDPIEKLILILGSEREGLEESVMNAATMRVRIPMAEGIDSLNVAAAAAVACYGLTSRSG
jgi:tRNA G18 (ribose-2'-O)-methylase SpoU